MGGEIPASGDVVSEGRSGADFASQSEVADFEDVLGNEQVFRFEVPMEEAVLVHVCEGGGELEEDVPA